MEFLIPRSGQEAWQMRIGRLAEASPLLPFAEEVICFVDAVSRRVLVDPLARAWPELLVVAHWMRKAHLRELQAAFCAKPTIRLARGLAVHYAPSNVDSIFVYSWFISLLSGNSNIIRLSQKRGEQLDFLIGRVNEVFERPEFENLRSRNLLVTYPHDDAVNAEICSRCAVRVLWGGDETVAALRRIPLPPLATEVAFADRFSLAVLRAQAICSCSAEELHGLAKRFCNDAFVFDQLACSSPRLIAWIGSAAEIAEAKRKFWTEVHCHVTKRQVSYPAMITMNRMTALFAYAATSQAASLASDTVTGFPLRIQLRADARDFRALHCGGGLFLEKDLLALEDLSNLLTSKDQTLSYFGYDITELRGLAMTLPARAVDRIVPVGEALEFAPTWDGLDLFMSFTRCVVIH